MNKIFNEMSRRSSDIQHQMKPFTRPSENIQRAINRFKSESAPVMKKSMGKAVYDNSISSNSYAYEEKKECSKGEKRGLGQLPDTS